MRFAVSVNIDSNKKTAKSPKMFYNKTGIMLKNSHLYEEI